MKINTLTTILALLTACQTIVAQRLPMTVGIEGKTYHLLYKGHSQDGNTAFAEVADSSGICGRASLSAQPDRTTGTLTIGTNQYSLYTTPSQTTISKRAIRSGVNDCLIRTSVSHKIMALMKKHALRRADISHPTIINLAVLYTPAAVADVKTDNAVLGWLKTQPNPTNSVITMLNVITQAVATANTSYADSQTYVQLNLVYTGSLKYTEVVPGNLVTDLQHVMVNTNAQAIRAKYSADIVTVIVDSTDPSYCGMSGGYDGNPALAYNVVCDAAILNSFVLPHEIGHNLGCDHERAYFCGCAAFPYSFGNVYTINGNSCGTIMAYQGEHSGCFSSPQVFSTGFFNTFTNVFYSLTNGPTGNATNDNVATIQQIAPYVAQFHTSLGAPTSYTLTLSVNGNGAIFYGNPYSGLAWESDQGTETNLVYLGQANNFTCSTTNYTEILSGVKSAQFVCWTGLTNTASTNISILATQDGTLIANFSDGTNLIAPIISQEPQNINSYFQSTASLTAAAYGIPAPTYQWTHNGSTIAGATNRTLTFLSLTTSDEGSYQCEIANTYGTTNSALATISLQDASVSIEPASISTTTNTSASFSFQFTSNAGTTFQWYFNGNPIAGATNSTYTIKTVKASNAGTYYAVANQNGNSIPSSAAILTVNAPPFFLPQPSNSLTLTTGQGINLFASATGSQPLAYQWQCNGTNLIGATNTTLPLSNLQPRNSGVYRLRAANPMATVYSPPTKIGVYTPLTATLANVVVYLGNPASLNVSVGGTAPVYQWYDNNGNLLPSTNNLCLLPAVQSNQAGMYTVIVTNPVSSLTLTTLLTVLSPPVITQQPTPVTTDAGSSATFTVAATGRTPFTYTWYQNGVALPNNNHPTLALNNLTMANVGAYCVKIANSDGSANSFMVNLTLNDLPVITSQPQNVVVTNGANASLMVSATGGQPLTYYWYQTNTLISSGPSSALVLPYASSANEGSYWVAISNWLGGVTSTSASLYVSTPPIITAQPVGAVLPSGQPLTLSVSSVGRPPLAYYWKLGTNVVAMTMDPVNSYTINSLQTNNNGIYTVLVSNTDGTATSAKVAVSALNTPWISQQPSNKSVNFNGNVTFTAKVSPAVAAYQWYDPSGNAIPFGYTNSLTLTNVQVEQAGTYYLSATTFGGSTNSATATLTVLDPPVWVQQPVGQTVFTNAALSLTGVAVTSQENINFQWFQGTNAILGANGNNYSITVADKTCVGTYKLLAWNNDGTNYSKAVSVTWVKQPPVLTAPLPTQVVVALGETLQIGLSLGGYDATGFQWFRNGMAVPGQNANPLSISPYAAANAGVYNACVTNQDGTLTTGNITVATAALPPIITQQPITQAVPAGTPATFSVGSSTLNNLSYQWLFNRNPISGQNGPTLTINSPSDGDIGNYSVIVSDSYGSTASKTANLYVIDVPTIIVQPKTDLTIAAGNTGTLSVKALCSYGTNQFQWQFNGNNIPGATASSYTIASASANNQGTYQVLVYNAAGSVLSTPCVVTTIQGPIITQPPIGSTNQPGDSATFTVMATGRGTLTYQWYYSGVPIPGQTDSSLTINSIEMWQTNAILVKVRNEDGYVNSTPVYIFTEAPPAIVNQPQSQSVAWGQNINLSCSATGSGGPLYYQWYFVPAYANGIGIGILGANSASFSTNAKTAAFQGSYYVIVSNLVGSVQSDSAAVGTLRAPVITTQPASQVTTLGSPATLTVNALGDQPMTFLWMHNGVVDSASSANILTIDSLTSSDLGSYSVCISNAIGGVISATAVLSANTNGLPPGIVAQPQNATVLSGKAATFTVVASGQAPLSFLWYDNGMPLPKQTTSSLTISNLNANSVGLDNYYVIVSNKNGAIQSATVTTALGSPATPPTIHDQPYTYPVVQYQTLDIAMSVSPDAYSFSWYQNGTFYASTPSPELIINHVGTSVAGKWLMVANNGQAKVTSSNVVVTVTTVPAITVQPVSKSVALSSNISLSVTATGTGPLAYQWYDPNGNAIPWGLTNILVITNAQPANEGSYSVSVINVNGEADSVPANLWVKQPPVITGQPAGASLNLNDSYTLSVTNTGHQPMTYLWFHNGIQLSDLSASSITLTGVQGSDAGTYSVMITNVDGGIVSSNVLINVLVAPYITTVTGSATIKAGTNYNLMATVGGAYAGLQWYLNGVGIPGANATNLYLTGISEANEGTYSLECSNQMGDLIQDVLILTVIDPPIITQPPTNTSMQIGLPVTLTVAANGRQPMTYQWYMGSTTIDSENAYITGGNTASITFTMAKNLAGTYKVAIFNADGSVSSSNAVVTVNTNPVVNGDKSHGLETPIAGTTATTNVYNGLFYGEAGIDWAQSGAITIVTTGTGYQGILTSEGVNYPFGGTSTNGQGQTTIQRKGQTTLGIAFELLTNTISGLVSDGIWSSPLEGTEPASNSATLPTAYNLWFNGTWAGTLGITNSIATLQAALPNFNITEACGLDQDGQFPVYMCNAIGWLQTTATSVTGTLIWLSPGGANQTSIVTSTPAE